MVTEIMLNDVFDLFIFSRRDRKTAVSWFYCFICRAAEKLLKNIQRSLTVAFGWHFIITIDTGSSVSELQSVTVSKLFIDANSVPGWLWVFFFFSLCKFMRVSGLRRQLEVIFKVFYSNSWEQWCNVTHEWLIQQPTRLWFLTETNGASSSIIKNKCCCWTDTVSLSNSSHTDSRYTFTY